MAEEIAPIAGGIANAKRMRCRERRHQGNDHKIGVAETALAGRRKAGSSMNNEPIAALPKKNPELLHSGFAPWGYKKNNKANLLFLDALDEERHVVLNHFQCIHARYKFSDCKINLIIAFNRFHENGFQATTGNIE